MCTFKEEVTDKTQFTGYKIVAKNIKAGKFYSPCTGIEYKPGLIIVPEVQKKITNFWQSVLDPENMSHIPEYKGMTAIFEKFEDAKSEFRCWENEAIECGFELIIIKMTIQKTNKRTCWIGSYGNHTTFIGPKIRSMKELY
jgi:hypothetical protein